MDAAYDPAQWNDFAIAVAGAAAALAGLLVVAVSINLREIIADSFLPARAGTAIIELTAPLITALFVLLPGQSSDALGVELMAIGIVLVVVLVPINSLRHRSPHRTMLMWFVASATPTVLLPVATFLAGLGMVLGSLGGLYWLAVAVTAAVIFGLIQAWALLIEILR